MQRAGYKDGVHGTTESIFTGGPGTGGPVGVGAHGGVRVGVGGAAVDRDEDRMHRRNATFQDWAAEETNHPRGVVEAALAHVVQNQVEAAYARSDLFERRRRLMNDWEAYLARERGR